MPFFPQEIPGAFPNPLLVSGELGQMLRGLLVAELPADDAGFVLDFPSSKGIDIIQKADDFLPIEFPVLRHADHDADRIVQSGSARPQKQIDSLPVHFRDIAAEVADAVSYEKAVGLILIAFPVFFAAHPPVVGEPVDAETQRIVSRPAHLFQIEFFIRLPVADPFGGGVMPEKTDRMLRTLLKHKKTVLLHHFPITSARSKIQLGTEIQNGILQNFARREIRFFSDGPLLKKQILTFQRFPVPIGRRCRNQHPDALPAAGKFNF